MSLPAGPKGEFRPAQHEGTPVTAVLRLVDLARAYADTPVFSGVQLTLQPGEFVALLGESGVGKSTLLNCIAGLDDADAGQITLAGIDVRALPEPGRAQLRREKLGFVFQAFHLLPHLSVAENIALPLLLLGAPDDARVTQLLQAVGLAGLGGRSPAQLSGGQLQRVALAYGHALWQLLTWKMEQPASALEKFRSNRDFGLIVFTALVAGTFF